MASRLRADSKQRFDIQHTPRIEEKAAVDVPRIFERPDRSGGTREKTRHQLIVFGPVCPRQQKMGRTRCVKATFATQRLSIRLHPARRCNRSIELLSQPTPVDSHPPHLHLARASFRSHSRSDFDQPLRELEQTTQKQAPCQTCHQLAGTGEKPRTRPPSPRAARRFDRPIKALGRSAFVTAPHARSQPQRNTAWARLDNQGTTRVSQNLTPSLAEVRQTNSSESHDHCSVRENKGQSASRS